MNLNDEMLDEILKAVLQLSGGDVNAALNLVCRQFANTEVVERGTEFLLGRLKELQSSIPQPDQPGQTSMIQGFTVWRTDAPEQ